MHESESVNGAAFSEQAKDNFYKYFSNVLYKSCLKLTRLKVLQTPVYVK